MEKPVDDRPVSTRPSVPAQNQRTRVPHKKPASAPAGDPTGVIIQHLPVADSRRSTLLCLLTFHAPENSLQLCNRELTAVFRPVSAVKRRLLLRFHGVRSLESNRPRRVPANAELLSPNTWKSDFQAHGRRLVDLAGVAFIRKTATKEDLPPTEAAVIRVLNFVRRNDDVGLISQAVKQDPGLLHGLLRYINTARIFFNTTHGGFRSIEHAILYMGYRQFSKWLSLYLLHSSVEGAMPALYMVSIVRARMMEVLSKSQGFPEAEADPIFITGIFSLLDRITGVPMDVILQSLELDPAVRDALLERKGPYAPLLALAGASENAPVDAYAGMMAGMGVTARQANLALLQAIEFAADFD
jgi:hypothetical protein